MIPLSGCTGIQSALDPKGPAASELAWLIWFFTGLCSLIWLAVMIVLIWGLSKRRGDRAEPLDIDEAGDRKATRVVTGAVAATVLMMIVLSLLSYFSNRTIAAIGGQNPVTIKLTGHQWWWEVRYESDQPRRTLTTANEIHIPAGEPVRVVLSSTDVIHSFWVPALHGKKDLIPGFDNELTLKADKPGVYRGQCAEFCGAQHAHMALMVVAEPREAFDGWYNAQLSNARQPETDEQRAGHDLFMNRPCIMCHKIQGTKAAANTGPDLTHLAGRQTIAAGTLHMSRGNLAAWIADPQSVKPGARMPTMNLSGDELNAVVAYLEHLK
ncbi:cytochrome c oxidase subunit II [Pseudaminobacter sp. 19-2017]|uniref:cytochrome-c oxidase n=1 Tax=Pseudaminobacter soli (ex Zhang et al. 2022) TaxID=2831468 RepID=A0A942DY09_9HYPH|nr:cytochrome c oxidase subunit II [Pseudaminobacter soli]MBS3650289.1 cytochrome c oxidase subunit II [Pseudaminobacter soli]